MVRKIELISASRIKENSLNIHNETDPEQIALMAESIEIVGLQEPLVVYPEDNSNNTDFIILSGHKRFAALRLSGRVNAANKVPCVIVDKPKSEIEERELLLQNNIARKLPEELDMQIHEADKIWNILPSDVREKKKKEFLAKFKREHKNNPSFQKDEERFIKNNYRPRVEYIRKMTGLGLSNKTVSAAITRMLDKSSEALPKERKKSKEKDVSISDLTKRMSSIAGLIDVYINKHGNDNKTVSNYLNDYKEFTEDILESIGNVK